MWREYGFVISSKYRKAVIFSLRERPKTPSEIALESKCNISHISRALRELSGSRLTECVNPDATKGRVYKLTEIGEKVVARMKRLT